MRVLDAVQMRQADRHAIEEIGIPSIVLMENAGRQAAAAIGARYSDLAERRLAVLCGRGNNGGDGLVAARMLWQQGVAVTVCLLGSEGQLTVDAGVNCSIARQLGLPIIEAGDIDAWRNVAADILDCDLVVDAILGTGATRPLEGFLATVVADVNAAGVDVIAVDMPTGLASDPTAPIGEAIAAAVTVALAAPKPALLLPPGAARAGDVVVADIGIPREVIEDVAGDRLHLLTAADVRAVLPMRSPEAHKGQCGNVLIAAGSAGKAGAAALAGRAALRSGAGLVTVAVPRSVADIVTAATPECMTLPLPETADGTLSAGALDALLAFECDVIAAGPGLGCTADIAAIVRGLLGRASRPLVLDADALNVMAAEPDSLVSAAWPVIVTPHPGEMARLAASTTADVQADRVGIARSFAREHRLHVVLKGAGTVLADPDGQVWLSRTGNAGMATAGAGDVLTGSLAAWLGQTGQATVACQLGVYLHGLAGDLARDQFGAEAMLASDIVEMLGGAVAAARRTTSDPEARQGLDQLPGGADFAGRRDRRRGR